MAVEIADSTSTRSPNNGRAAARACAANGTKSLSAKGQRARANLKQAALTVLERDGFHHMRIADVTREAGVAQGLFYHYFDDLKSLTMEVLADFINPASDAEAIEKDVARGDWYGRILAHNRLVVASYAKRPGVMRCLLQMADEDAAFSAALRDSYREQLMWLVGRLPRMFPQLRLRQHQALMTVYALAGIGEGLLREYFIHRSETLLAADLSEDELAELLSTMFYRALFLEHPPLEKLHYTRNLAAMHATPHMESNG